MKNAHISTAASTLSPTELATLLAGGYCRVYDGTQPAFVEEPVTTQKVLAELPLGTPGVEVSEYTVRLIVPIYDWSADDKGNATWFRLWTSGDVGVFDGTIGLADANLVSNTTAIPVGAKVTILTLVITTEVGASPSKSESASPSVSLSGSPSFSRSGSPSASPSVSVSASPSAPSLSASLSPSTSPSVSVSGSPSLSPSPS